jgi:hypothetical protein
MAQHGSHRDGHQQLTIGLISSERPCHHPPDRLRYRKIKLLSCFGQSACLLQAMTDATLKQIQSRRRVKTREKMMIIDCSQQTEMLPYIRRILLQIGSRTVAMASLSPAPAVCTPALHKSQAKRSASLRVGAWY